MLESLSDESSILKLLTKMYDLLKAQDSGILFGHDTLSFIIDQNLNQLSRGVVSLVERCQMHATREMCYRLLLQLGRVRSNPADYLAVLTGWVEEPTHKKGIDFAQDMVHIATELQQLVERNHEDESQQTAQKAKEFKETLHLSRGKLFFYQAGEYKLDVSS